MFVSIRDPIVMQTGFDSLHEALSFYDLQHVEMQVDKDYGLRSINPTVEHAKLFLNRPEDVATLERQTKGSGLHITAFLLHNDFNAPDQDKELALVTDVVKAAAHLGVPAVRLDSIMSGQKDLPLDRRIELFSKGARIVLDRTDKEKVALAIENHGAQGNDPAFLDGVFDKVRSKRLGMTLDVGNFYWSGKPLSEVYRILSRPATPILPRASLTFVEKHTWRSLERYGIRFQDFGSRLVFLSRRFQFINAHRSKYQKLVFHIGKEPVVVREEAPFVQSKVAPAQTFRSS